LLLAQDVLWVLFSEFPQKLGYLQPLIWRKKKLEIRENNVQTEK